MKRKNNKVDEDEARLSRLLFKKTKKFSEKLIKTDDLLKSDLELKPAWTDEDDNSVIESRLSNTKNADYTQKLKQKYETLMGVPNWAKITKKANTEKDDDDSDNVLRTVGHLRKQKKIGLKSKFLETKYFPKINATTGNEGKIISCVEFHPKLSVALVAGSSGVVSLFSVGGDVNSKLHNFNLKGWKVSTAHFTPEGTQAFISSKYRHEYCLYDLVKAEPKLIQLPHTIKHPLLFEMSTDGKYIAASDGFDDVYLIAAAPNELLRKFKHNTKVASVIFSHDSKQLYCYGVQGEVTIWDLSTYRSVRKFYDNGCVTAACLTMSPCGRLLATGSGEGIVNIYEVSKLNESSAYEPLPIKTIANLTTKITNITFNSTTEILAASSGYFPNAVKLVHIPSYHVFSNFPEQAFNIGQVDTVRFSPNSGFMALGNNNHSALLYRLKYYKNY